jgi:hypothetical protein
LGMNVSIMKPLVCLLTPPLAIRTPSSPSPAIKRSSAFWWPVKACRIWVENCSKGIVRVCPLFWDLTPRGDGGRELGGRTAIWRCSRAKGKRESERHVMKQVTSRSPTQWRPSC